jgi:hypothetical protein
MIHDEWQIQIERCSFECCQGVPGLSSCGAAGVLLLKYIIFCLTILANISIIAHCQVYRWGLYFDLGIKIPARILEAVFIFPAYIHQSECSRH